MRRTHENNSRARVAHNVNYLIERQKWVIGSLIERSKVSETMLRKIRKGDNVSVEYLDKLAHTFGVPTRLLLSEDIESELDFASQLQKLQVAYKTTSEIGRSTIDQAVRAAEEFARYHVKNE